MTELSSKPIAGAEGYDRKKTAPTREFGSRKGLYGLPGAFFFDPLPEDELRLFEGGGDEPSSIARRAD